MPVLTREEAVRELTRVVKQLRGDDLLEVHNELWPDQPITAEPAPEHEPALLQQVVARIGESLEPEEIVSLWTVIFPFQRVLYDESDDRIYVNEPLAEAAPTYSPEE